MLEFTIVALAVLWAVVLLQGSVLIELLRQVAHLRESIPQKGAAKLPDEGLPIGSSAPALGRFRTVAGSPIAVEPTASYLVVVYSAECATCREVAREVGVLDLDIGAPVVHVVRGASESAVATFIREFKLPERETVADIDGALADAFRITTTPTAVVVGSGKVLGQGIVNAAREAVAFYGLTQGNAAQGSGRVQEVAA